MDSDIRSRQQDKRKVHRMDSGNKNTGRTRKTVQILMVGSELLRGVYPDTNGHFLARSLTDVGIEVLETRSLPDKIEKLVGAIRQALRDSDLVIISGGLGPTVDDLTREAISEATGISMIINDDIIEVIEQRFSQRGLMASENNRRQALVPERGGFFHNPHGTAPGLYFDADEALVVALPGPPREMYPMFVDSLLPLLKQRRLTAEKLPSHLIRLAGVPESRADQRLELILADFPNSQVSILARPNLVDVTLFHRDREKLLQLVDRVKDEFGIAVYTEEDISFDEVVGNLLRERGLQLGLAESCTGGLLGGAMTEIPGASGFFTGGVVSYSNEVKRNLLNVPAEVLERHGAVSEETAAAMARGALKTLHCTVALSVTGIAGPGGGTESKPVGLVYVGCADADRTEVKKLNLIGDRKTVRTWAVRKALDFLRLFLLKHPNDFQK